VKYKYLQNVEPQKAIMAFEWAEEYKTTILLNGGMDKNLIDLVGFLDHKDNNYPWEFFRESEEALNCALTNVSIVLPEKIYMHKKWTTVDPYKPSGVALIGYRGSRITLDDGTVHEYNTWELDLIELINSKELMR
jgi:hypothetical protein